VGTALRASGRIALIACTGAYVASQTTAQAGFVRCHVITTLAGSASGIVCRVAKAPTIEA